MHHDKLIPHLFRTEFSRITAVLAKHFGMNRLEVAEDIASETFVAALETWPHRGIPDNPSAWLYTVAKNKARSYLHREQIFSEKVVPQQATPVAIVPDLDLTDQQITDAQLQMLFAVCHPSISAEAQVGLALRLLCGFGIEEIANAFLTNK